MDTVCRPPASRRSLHGFTKVSIMRAAAGSAMSASPVSIISKK